MSTAEKIYLYLQELPEALLNKVLEFIENLDGKSDLDFAKQKENSWQNFSLSMALSGMVDDDLPEYSIEDLKEVFDEKNGTDSSL